MFEEEEKIITKTTQNAVKVPTHFVALHLTLTQLEGAARYANLLLAPAEGFGLRQRPFVALRAKQRAFHTFLAHILVIFGDQL